MEFLTIKMHEASVRSNLYFKYCNNVPGVFLLKLFLMSTLVFSCSCIFRSPTKSRQ